MWCAFTWFKSDLATCRWYPRITAHQKRGSRSPSFKKTEATARGATEVMIPFPAQERVICKPHIIQVSSRIHRFHFKCNLALSGYVYLRQRAVFAQLEYDTNEVRNIHTFCILFQRSEEFLFWLKHHSPSPFPKLGWTQLSVFYYTTELLFIKWRECYQASRTQILDDIEVLRSHTHCECRLSNLVWWLVTRWSIGFWSSTNQCNTITAFS